MLSVSI